MIRHNNYLLWIGTLVWAVQTPIWAMSATPWFAFVSAAMVFVYAWLAVIQRG